MLFDSWQTCPWPSVNCQAWSGWIWRATHSTPISGRWLVTALTRRSVRQLPGTSLPTWRSYKFRWKQKNKRSWERKKVSVLKLFCGVAVGMPDYESVGPCLNPELVVQSSPSCSSVPFEYGYVHTWLGNWVTQMPHWPCASPQAQGLMRRRWPPRPRTCW